MRTIDIRKSTLTGPIVIVIILGLLYGLDMVRISWRRQADQAFDTTTFNYFVFVLPVVFAILIIFLAWFLLVFFRPSWVTLVFCLLVGAGIQGFVFPLIAAAPILSPLANSPAFTGLRTVLYDLGTGSMTLQAGAFILVIGLTDLARKISTTTQHN